MSSSKNALPTDMPDDMLYVTAALKRWRFFAKSEIELQANEITKRHKKNGSSSIYNHERDYMDERERYINAATRVLDDIENWDASLIEDLLKIIESKRYIHRNYIDTVDYFDLTIHLEKILRDAKIVEKGVPPELLKL